MGARKRWAQNPKKLTQRRQGLNRWLPRFRNDEGAEHRPKTPPLPSTRGMHMQTRDYVGRGQSETRAGRPLWLTPVHARSAPTNTVNRPTPWGVPTRATQPLYGLAPIWLGCMVAHIQLRTGGWRRDPGSRAKARNVSRGFSGSGNAMASSVWAIGISFPVTYTPSTGSRIHPRGGARGAATARRVGMFRHTAPLGNPIRNSIPHRFLVMEIRWSKVRFWPRPLLQHVYAVAGRCTSVPALPFGTVGDYLWVKRTLGPGIRFASVQAAIEDRGCERRFRGNSKFQTISLFEQKRTTPARNSGGPYLP
jgi:hypothetical protein